MALETIEVISGTQADKVLNLRDENGQTITTYQNTDNLTAAIWSGDDQGTLSAPAVSWHGGLASSGRVDLTISAGDIEALPPAMYRLMVWVSRGAVKRPVLNCWLRVKPAPGLGVPLKVYGSYQDLLLKVPTLESVQAEGSQSEFAEERAAARDELDRLVLNQCRGEFDRRYVEDRLAEGRMVQDRGVREFAACYALALILEGRSSGKKPDEDPWPATAMRLRGQASAMAKSITVYVDLSPEHDGSYHRPFNLSLINTYRG